MAVLLLLTASGCPVGPDFVRPDVRLNATWSEAGSRLVQSQIDQAWWHAFNDPTLDRLIELAYQENLPLQIAGLRILEARATVGIAYGFFYPQNIAPIASAQGRGFSEHAANAANLDRFFGDYQVGFDAVWELDFWGKYRRGLRAAKATYFATIADYDNALVLVAAEVARVYAVMRTFETFIALVRENITVQEEGLRIAESRFRNGATSELDVTQAANLLESTRATLPEQLLGLQQAQNALCTLLGRPTGCVPLLMLSGTAAIPAPPAQVAVSVPAELMRRRPDIRGAELRAVAQCNRIGAAKAELFPSFELFGSVGTQSASGVPNGSFLDLFGPGSLIFNFGARLFWPIFNYPKILNNVRVQDARLQQLLFDYRFTVLRAAQEVEDASMGLMREQESLVFAVNAATAAQSSVKLAFIQYREGAVDFIRVLDAQRTLLQSQNNVARTRSAVATNLIALYKALGGGWELRENQPVVRDAARIEMQKRTNWGKYFSNPR